MVALVVVGVALKEWNGTMGELEGEKKLKVSPIGNLHPFPLMAGEMAELWPGCASHCMSNAAATHTHDLH